MELLIGLSILRTIWNASLPYWSDLKKRKKPLSNPEVNVPLYPNPVMEMPTMEGITGLECLESQDPIEDPQHLALHVAQLTGVVKFLLERIEELENVQRND